MADDRPTHDDRAENCEIEITPEVIETGLSVFYDLEGEVSKVYLVKAVFQAMERVRCCNEEPKSN